MARQSNLDTTRQEFLKEAYSKESKLRNTWFQGYFGSNQLPSHLSTQTSTSPMPVSKNKAGPTRINIKPAPPSPINAAPAVPASPSDFVGKRFVEMRTPTPETKNMVFAGLSAEGDGRKAYLIQRKFKSPEEKFLYPVTSAQEVGWDIKAVTAKVETRPAFFGKNKIVQETFFRKNGMED